MGQGRFWWQRRSVSLLVGLACVVIGVVLVTRPFTSLSVLTLLVGIALVVTGFAEVTNDEASARWLHRLIGVGWIAAGIVALAWPDLTVAGVAVLVGIAMVVGGAAQVLAGVRGSTDERLSAVIGGVASVVFGALALAWPDVTILVVAVVFGARTVLYGLSRIGWAFHRGDAADAAPRPRGRIRRWGRVVVSVVALVLAIGLAGISAQLRQGEPVVDAFYDAPDDVPGEPGVLLRAEPFERGVPDGARAWRILYTTTRDEGEPALASGLVVAPAEQAADPHPVVAWAHGTTGVDETCAPSVLDDPFGAGAFYALDDVIEQGWALVATDYVGLGTEGPHPYLIGQGEGRSVLDAVRAARQLDDLTVEDRTIVWGHSQGGHAALWTGQLAESYAPDVGVAGVAALAPASDLIGLVRNLPNVPGGSIFASYVAGPYADIYDELDLGEYVASGGEVTVRQIGERCLAEPSVFVSIVGSLATGMEIFSGDLSTGTMGELLAANSPTGPIPAPLLIGQGLADPLVLPAVQEGYVERLCASGQQVDFRTYEGRDHVGVVNADSPLLPELITWTQERLAGAEPIDTCG